MEMKITLDLREVRRLLFLFSESPQNMSDKELWLKIKRAEERLEKKHDDDPNAECGTAGPLDRAPEQ